MLLDQLETLSRDDWIAIGHRAIAQGATTSPAERRADDALAAVIHRQGLEVAAWLVRDDVETLASLANCADDAVTGRRYAAPPCTKLERAILDAARRAVERAALALLARPWLEASDCDVLTAPCAAMLAGRVP
jgi:hypothetical protein